MHRGAAVSVFGMPVVLREHEQTFTGLYAEQARQWYEASSPAAVRARAGLMRFLLFLGGRLQRAQLLANAEVIEPAVKRPV